MESLTVSQSLNYRSKTKDMEIFTKICSPTGDRRNAHQKKTRILAHCKELLETDFPPGRQKSVPYH